MFITVKFGEGNAITVNPDCKNNILLESIKYRCGLDEDELVDLSDESGSVKQLHLNLLDYGTSYFEDRETTILLRVEKTEEGGSDDSLYTPLLHGLEDDSAFLGKLNPKQFSKYRKSDLKGSRKFIFKNRQTPKKSSPKTTTVSKK